MVTDFRALAPGDTLARAAALTLSGFQQDFPVMEGGALVGILTQADLVRAMAQAGTDTFVEVAMQRRFETARPSEMLDVALAPGAAASAARSWWCARARWWAFSRPRTSARCSPWSRRCAPRGCTRGRRRSVVFFDGDGLRSRTVEHRQHEGVAHAPRPSHADDRAVEVGRSPRSRSRSAHVRSVWERPLPLAQGPPEGLDGPPRAAQPGLEARGVAVEAVRHHREALGVARGGLPSARAAPSPSPSSTAATRRCMASSRSHAGASCGGA